MVGRDGVDRSVGERLTERLDVRFLKIGQFLDDGTFTAQSGKRIKFDAKCILVHSDTPGAVGIAQAVRQTIEKGGGTIVPFTDLAI